MDRQQKLFPDLKTTISVAEDRAEPRLWVRRLKIWSKPGEVIREVRLRRGFNIVWSPDPAEDNSKNETRAGSSHGAGKTLFCRLIRYCVGEETFATDDQRLAIGSAFACALLYLLQDFAYTVRTAGRLWVYKAYLGSPVIIGSRC